MDSGVGVPIGAEVQLTDTGQLQLLDDEGKVTHPPCLPPPTHTPGSPLIPVLCTLVKLHKVDKKNEGKIRQMHPSSVTGVDDMIMLGDLNEEGLLRNLLVRHKEGKIYVSFCSSSLSAEPPSFMASIICLEMLTRHLSIPSAADFGLVFVTGVFVSMETNQPQWMENVAVFYFIKAQRCVLCHKSTLGKKQYTYII